MIQDLNDSVDVKIIEYTIAASWKKYYGGLGISDTNLTNSSLLNGYRA
jgi:hypothetical protein